MRYKLILMPEAERHLQEWRKSGQKKTLLKIAALLEELCEHPTTGTGKVEQLKGDLEGFWSRRINKESRLIYKIEEEIITVFVVSLKGHYGAVINDIRYYSKIYSCQISMFFVLIWQSLCIVLMSNNICIKNKRMECRFSKYAH